MARGGTGGCQRDQITRPETPHAVQLTGTLSRKRTFEVIVLVSEDKEDGDYGVRKRQPRPAATRSGFLCSVNNALAGLLRAPHRGPRTSGRNHVDWVSLELI